MSGMLLMVSQMLPMMTGTALVMPDMVPTIAARIILMWPCVTMTSKTIGIIAIAGITMIAGKWIAVRITI